ncbi:translocation/assembly module TamB domain-containing protein [Agrobacterium sp. NPDC090273]|uniref:translocation/assembly module TamB domain-containing protein n=1 Tax=Agrobacterium sp. NPDC090273 TaxID=3363919 RepID=UPI00383B607B
MTMLIRLLKWLGYIVLCGVVLLLLAVLFVGFTPIGARIAADQVSSLVSSPDQKIEISPPRGLLTGRLRLDNVTLSDRQGAYARVDDIAVDWSPLSLLAGTFHADMVSARSIEVDRKPLPAAEKAETSSSGFSLPIEIGVDNFNFPDISLAEPLLGRSFDLRAEGSLKAATDDIRLSLAANRQDLQDAEVNADIAFLPNENVLKLKAELREPQGGLLATLLSLPDAPAVSIDLNGEGPLSDWTGTLNGNVAGNRVLNLSGHHVLAADGARRIEITGGGQPDLLLPPDFRQLFAGETKLDATTTLFPQGRIEVGNSTLETGALLLTASGNIDPTGQNDLNANLIGMAGPVDFRWPIENGELQALIDGIDLSLRGNADAASLNASASIRSLSLPQGKLDAVKLTATSNDLNLTDRSGTVETVFTVAQSSFTSPDIDRVVRAPVTIKAPLTISETAIGFDGATLESASVGGTINGAFDLSGKRLSSAVQLFALPATLPEALASKFDTTIALKGDIDLVIGGSTSVRNLDLKSGTLEAAGDVSLENGSIRANLTGRLPQLQKLTPQATGTADFTVDASGALSAPDFNIGISSESAVLAGRKLEALKLNASGKADASAPQAKLTASGSLDKQAINVDANVVQTETGTAIPELNVAVGKNILKGQLQFSPQFLPEGNLSFDFPDLSLLAALAAQQAAGDVAGNIVLSNDNGKIAATIKANGGTIRQGTTTISKLAADVTIDDLQALAINGTVKADSINAGAAAISGLTATVAHTGTSTEFNLNGRYDNAPIVAKGSAETGGSPMTVRIDEFSAAPKGIPVRLEKPTSIAIQQGTARISDLAIVTGQGRIEVNGTAGSALDLNVDIRALPASLANAFAAGLDAAGNISGTVTAKGAASDPAVTYDLNWADAAVSQTRAAGLAPLGIKANGRFAGGNLQIDTNVTGQGGMALSGGGSLGISGNRPISMAFSGNLPFAALAAQTAAQGLDVSGTAAIDVKISGSATSPVITGSVTTDGTRVIDVRRNLTLNDVGATITFDRDRAVISRLTGKLAGGGTISGAGSVGITGGFPADLTITLNRAGYNDGTLVTTVVSGTVTLKGPLLSGLVLGGNLTLDRSAITIPERLPASLTEIDVKHKNAPPQVRAQNKALGADQGGSGSSSTINLDLQVNAPSGIFVRGRGIDAELTGNLTIRGTAAVPVISGGFEMRRGRLEILTRRLDFNTGNITFGGGLVPVLDMEAQSSVGSTTVTVAVTGNANDPAFVFSSSPVLPQDEVMAQLIFGQSMSKLSALQIARLADAAGQLAGGRSTSLFDKLRSNLGVDDLDISTDSEGQARVSAGKYLNERTYLELQQSGDSGAKAIINLDVGKGVKLRGEAGGDGEGAAGIFYEKEY